MAGVANVAIPREEIVDAVLAHYGVKGMRWGVRKDHKGVRRGNPTAHRDAILAKKAQEKVKKGSVDALSNDELKNLVTRLGLEKQFDTLKPPTAGSRTKKLVGEVLLSVGKQQASKAVNDVATKQVTRLLANASR